VLFELEMSTYFRVQAPCWPGDGTPKTPRYFDADPKGDGAVNDLMQQKTQGIKSKTKLAFAAKNRKTNDEKVQQRYLSFMIGNEVYGVSILKIKEIIEYSSITRIPTTPIHIAGAINLRGSVVPVINLSARIGMLEVDTSKRSCIVIVDISDDDGVIEVGIMVDRVNEVLSFYEEQIKLAPSFGTNIRADFIEGMGKVGEEFVTLLNMDAVLDVNELAKMDSTGITPYECVPNN